MNRFDDCLKEQLSALEREGLRRELRRIDSAQGRAIVWNGQTLVNFSSNDYLGLAGHPVVREAAIRAIEQFGAGSGASRLICGSLAPHHELEEALAAFKGVEAALTFSSGYAAALGTIGALLGREDVIIVDKLVHASIVDAARLSGAALRVFDHNDPASLEKKLKWAAARRNERKATRTLVVTESVFSMDGDLAPLRNIVELKERYGAWLMIDEAHATGLFGAGRRGLAEACELAGQIEIQMGTLGKALGASGGYICGSRSLIDLLVNRARSFIFSTAPVPAASAAAKAAIELLQSAEGEERRVRTWSLVDQFKNALVETKRAPGLVQSPIVPIVVGESAAALVLSAELRARGFFVPAIRYPTVPRNAARLRVTITAAHTPEDVRALATALGG